MRLVDLAADPMAEIPRPNAADDVAEGVAGIIDRVRAGGDDALRKLTQELDGVGIDSLRVSDDEIDAAAAAVDDAVMNAMEATAENIRTVAEHQRLRPWEAEVAGGIVGEYINPVNRAGIYVPGGRASYPSTVLMTAMPARVAGVKEIVMCVPPGKDGKVAPATLAAAGLCAVDEVYCIGGAQAIAAMAYGTETIKPADVIVGPGNAYVAEAKKQVAGEVGIESIAGPSEIVIVADSSADPGLVALDLIAQAEHGPGGLLAVVCWDA
ncbi:MAG: histidinol dehydrogenase, partial [Actinomycetota bacterium]